MDAGSAGVPPAMPEGRIGYRQTILSIRHKPAERGFIGIHNLRKQSVGLIKHLLNAIESFNGPALVGAFRGRGVDKPSQSSEIRRESQSADPFFLDGRRLG